MTLLERLTAHTVLTPIGRSAAAKARGVLSEVRDIEMLARSAATGLTGTPRLGTTPTLGPYLLSPIIAQLHQSAPGLRLNVREGIPDAQALAVPRGDLDVLLGPLPIAGDDLEIEPLFRELLYLVGAVDSHLATATRSIESPLTTACRSARTTKAPVSKAFSSWSPVVGPGGGNYRLTRLRDGRLQ